MISICQDNNEIVHKRELFYDGYDHVCHGGYPARKDLCKISLRTSS